MLSVKYMSIVMDVKNGFTDFEKLNQFINTDGVEVIDIKQDFIHTGIYHPSVVGGVTIGRMLCIVKYRDLGVDLTQFTDVRANNIGTTPSVIGSRVGQPQNTVRGTINSVNTQPVPNMFGFNAGLPSNNNIDTPPRELGKKFKSPSSMKDEYKILFDLGVDVCNLRYLTARLNNITNIIGPDNVVEEVLPSEVNGTDVILDKDRVKYKLVLEYVNGQLQFNMLSRSKTYMDGGVKDLVDITPSHKSRLKIYTTPEINKSKFILAVADYNRNRMIVVDTDSSKPVEFIACNTHHVGGIFTLSKHIFTDINRVIPASDSFIHTKGKDIVMFYNKTITKVK
ncbi:MAG: hypothetical protein ACRCX2_12810 [Paraclostridium sp.]